MSDHAVNTTQHALCNCIQCCDLCHVLQYLMCNVNGYMRVGLQGGKMAAQYDSAAKDRNMEFESVSSLHVYVRVFMGMVLSLLLFVCCL